MTGGRSPTEEQFRHYSTVLKMYDLYAESGVPGGDVSVGEPGGVLDGYQKPARIIVYKTDSGYQELLEAYKELGVGYDIKPGGIMTSRPHPLVEYIKRNT